MKKPENLKQGDVCPECKNGNLQIETEPNTKTEWLHCDGLTDGGNPKAPLDACKFTTEN